MRLKLSFLILFTIFLNFQLTMGMLDTECQQTDPLNKKIANINMKTFAWEDMSWDEGETWVEFIEMVTNKILNPTPRQKRGLTFSLLQATDVKITSDATSVDSISSWIDLSLFAGKSNPEKFVANQVDRTSTEIGKVMLYYLLGHPTKDIAALLSRQNLVSFLIKNKEILNNISTELNAYKKSENVILAFWGQACLKNATERCCFFSMSGTQFLNQSEIALLVHSLFSHGSRIYSFGCFSIASVLLFLYGISILVKLDQSSNAEFKSTAEWLRSEAEDFKASPSPVIPTLWKYSKQKYFHAILALASGALCAMNIKKEWDWVYGCLLIEKKLQQLLIHIACCVKSISNAYNIIKNNDILLQQPEFQGLINLFEKDIYQNAELSEFLSMLENETFDGDPSWICHKGKVLRAYKLMLNVRNKLQNAICSFGFLDAFVSAAKLMQESNTQKCKFTFPQYIQSNSPSIEIKNFWNPMLDPNSAIPNSLILGTKNCRSNAIITGPNEGGKSTILTSIALCLIFAQSLGFVPAQSMEFTPFKSIKTYMNISADIGSGNSLFKAEVLCAQNLIDQIKKSKNDDFCFVLFDEIFNGTSPIEGAAAAFSVAKYLARFDNNICMISTHFELLTKLETETDKFSNYRVRVIKKEDGSLFHPYTLESGISEEHVALDILKNQGFSSEIIDDANKIVNQILAH